MGTSRTLLNPACVLQKDIVRAFLVAPKKAHTRELFHKIGLLKFECVLCYITCTFSDGTPNDLTINEMKMKWEFFM